MATRLSGNAPYEYYATTRKDLTLYVPVGDASWDSAHPAALFVGNLRRWDTETGVVTPPSPLSVYFVSVRPEHQDANNPATIKLTAERQTIDPAVLFDWGDTKPIFLEDWSLVAAANGEMESDGLYHPKKEGKHELTAYLGNTSVRVTFIVQDDGNVLPVPSATPAPTPSPTPFSGIYTVWFSVNGNTVDICEVEDGETVVEPPLPVLAKSISWYTDTWCTVPFDLATPITSDLRIYGEVTQNDERLIGEYAVAVDLGGHASLLKSPAAKYPNGALVKLLVGEPESGMELIGWEITYRDTSGHLIGVETKKTQSLADVRFNMPVGNVSAHALWTKDGVAVTPTPLPNPHTVTFHFSRNDAGVATQVADGGTVIVPEPIIYDGPNYWWYTDLWCNDSFDLNTPITSDLDLYAENMGGGVPFGRFTPTIDLGGHATFVTAPVSWFNDGTFYNNRLVKFRIEPAPGLELIGWEITGEDFGYPITSVNFKETQSPLDVRFYMPAGDVTLRALWTKDGVAVTPVPSPSATPTPTPSATATPTPIHGIAPPTVSPSATHIPATDPVAGKMFAIDFNTNGGIYKGTTLKMRTMLNTAGKAFRTPIKPTRKGYKFAGWYTKKKGGVKLDTNDKVKSLGKQCKKYYAHWTKKKPK